MYVCMYVYMHAYLCAHVYLLGFAGVVLGYGLDDARDDVGTVAQRRQRRIADLKATRQRNSECMYGCM